MANPSKKAVKTDNKLIKAKPIRKSAGNNTAENKLIKAERLKLIKEYLLQGNIRTPESVTKFAEQLNCDKSLVYKYFQEANAEIFKDYPSFKNDYKKLIAARLEELYDKTTQVRDYKEARQNLTQLCKMYGLTDPEEHKIMDTTIKFSFGDVVTPEDDIKEE